MARECEYCGKSTVAGNRVPRKGKSKKQGGNGEHIVARTGRTFKANIFKMRATVNGVPCRVKVCARCIKSGKIVR